MRVTTAVYAFCPPPEDPCPRGPPYEISVARPAWRASARPPPEDPCPRGPPYEMSVAPPAWRASVGPPPEDPCPDGGVPGSCLTPTFRAAVQRALRSASPGCQAPRRYN